MEEAKRQQLSAEGEQTAAVEEAREPEAEGEEEGSEECRICRSSARELLEAEVADGRCGCGCCRRPSPQPPLRRLRCACSGSVRHVCARCYRRYYVARGLRACEICRQPTGLEGDDADGGGRGFCRRLATFACSEEIRYLSYAIFILVAFISIFALFFVASAADDPDPAASTSASKKATATPRPPDPQRRLERFIFVGIAVVNLSFALTYIGFSYWRHCRRGQCCSSGSDGGQHRRHRSGGSVSVGFLTAMTAATTANANSTLVETVTVTIRQQPQLFLPPVPSASLSTEAADRV